MLDFSDWLLLLFYAFVYPLLLLRFMVVEHLFEKVFKVTWPSPSILFCTS